MSLSPSVCRYISRQESGVLCGSITLFLINNYTLVYIKLKDLKEFNIKSFTLFSNIVLFSGGKDLRGPQSCGLILGKKDIVNICRLHGYPHHAIGRPMKLDKETIMGFVKAIELYLKENHQKRIEIWEKQVRRIFKGLSNISHVQVFKGCPTQPLTQPATIPRIYVKFNEEVLGLTKENIAKELYQGNPRIAVVVEKNYLVFNPHMLGEGEEDLIVERMKEVMKKYNK